MESGTSHNMSVSHYSIFTEDQCLLRYNTKCEALRGINKPYSPKGLFIYRKACWQGQASDTDAGSSEYWTPCLPCLHSPLMRTGDIMRTKVLDFIRDALRRTEEVK